MSGSMGYVQLEHTAQELEDIVFGLNEAENLDKYWKNLSPDQQENFRRLTEFASEFLDLADQIDTD
ncbi:hypothetical protein [Acaryochloris marina]|uniref:Uncharacterized protein n=1 Tax=Acaryochloris marina (strain MBIC 11017) TaxID=329726 RepID=A8ZL93_ACAM1|nr:hypothetical protein [Acaryochloris marina]ABW31920.1 hypothetical protein AM1_B0200 [Acaryochloris marina MBIC11017]BDM82920.1 hypothetical protein AM10699_57810 [Acaryochloris marina MBIC10699]